MKKKEQKSFDLSERDHLQKGFLSKKLSVLWPLGHNI